MATVLQRSTNLNFPRKQKFNSSVHESDKKSNSAVVVTHHSGTPNILRKKSKIGIIFDELTRNLRRYPQLRPGVCTIIIGIVFLLVAVLMFAVAAVKDNTASWFRILVLVGSILVMLGGTAGLLRNYCLLKTHLKFQRDQALKMTPLAEGSTVATVLNPTNNPNPSTVIEITDVDLTVERMGGNADDFQHRNVPTRGTADRIRKIGQVSNRRKLPGSPVVKPFNFDAALAGNANTHSQCLQVDTKYGACGGGGVNSKRLLYFSSEPDLVTCGRKEENLKLLKNNRLKTDSRASNKQDSVYLTLEPSPNNTVADEIFDVFHDPLLYSAITRLKFKCDYEFLSST